METSSCITALLQYWITRFGVRAVITTDRGRQLVSATWATFCQWLGINHVTTTAYHPQSNGMVERAHRQLKDALRARLADSD
jgi:transposase InsO family protein